MKQLIVGRVESIGGNDFPVTFQIHGGNIAGNSTQPHYTGYVIETITIKNLVVEEDVDTAVWSIYIVAQDGTKTITAVTATSSGGRAVSTASVTLTPTGLSAVRLFCLLRNGIPANNGPASWSFEIETATDFRSFYFYGLNGSFIDSEAGGLFGTWSGTSVTVPSNSFSLNCAKGKVVKLGMIARFDFFGPGTPDPTQGYDAYVAVNGVVQDGTGGTVDTKVSVRYTDNGFCFSDIKSFNVPSEVQDVVEWFIVVVNGPLPSLSSPGITAAYDADNAGEFSICGSISTVGIVQDVPNYSGFNTQWGTSAAIKNVAGITSFELFGLQYYLGGTFPVGKIMTLDALIDLVAQADRPTITINPGDGKVIDDNPDHKVRLVNESHLTIRAVINLTDAIQMHWAIGARFVAPVLPGGGIYKLIPSKTHDTLYTENDPVDVKIPDPYYDTYFVGDE